MTPRERDLEAIVRRYGLSADAREPLRVLLDLFVSDRSAPTALRDCRTALDGHVADALVALELEPVRKAELVADIGSGAGVPGIPLAVAKPTASFVLVESNRRRCAFIARAVTACRLDNVEVVNARAEEWRAGIDRFELVTARALASLEVVAEYAAPLLVQGGHLLAWRGMRDPASEGAAASAARELGLSEVEVRAVRPYAGANARHLHLFRKEKPTPPRFPRRPGMARKRPVGQRTASV